MEINKYLNLLKNKKQTIVIILSMFLLLSISFTFVQPIKYASSANVLIVQSFDPGVDPYTISRSNEYLSGLLAKVVASDSFYNEVLNSGFDINKEYFNGNAEKRMKIWEKTVSAEPQQDSGIIAIKTFHTSKEQANEITEAIIFNLRTTHGQYDGLGDKVNFKIIDKPMVASWPAQPNIIFNLIMGWMLGVAAALSYIYLFPEEEYSLRIIPKRKEVEIETSEEVAMIADEYMPSEEEVVMPNDMAQEELEVLDNIIETQEAEENNTPNNWYSVEDLIIQKRMARN